MKRRIGVFFPALLIAAATFAASSAWGQATSISIKLKIIEGRPVADVFINGKGPYAFLLDTGSQRNQMDRGLAAKLGIAASFQTTLVTPSGGTLVSGARVPSVALGPIQLANQVFLIAHSYGLSSLSPNIRGILGQDFLARFDYTLDYHHHLLTFGSPVPEGIPIPFHLIHGRMAVPTSQGDLVVDSGTEMLFLYRRVGSAANFRVITSSGMSVPVAVERAPALQIGDLVYHADSAIFSPVHDAQEDGLLPTSLFRSIFICNSQHFVVFDSGKH